MAKEIERKFLIKRPSMSRLMEMDAHLVGYILQTYLTSIDNKERRVREYISYSKYYHTYTEKTDIEEMVREENERIIDPMEYSKFLRERDPERISIKKTRYILEYRGHTFEIDLYDFDTEYAIMEVELQDVNDPVVLPSFEFIKEVTGDKDFSNYMLAKYKKIPI